MLELVMFSRPGIVKPFFRIDFRDSEVGSQTLPLESMYPIHFQRVTRNGDNTDGVVDHPVYGKCYRFTGNVVFQETNVSNFLNLLPRPSFSLKMKFVTEATVSMPFYTGRDGGTSKNGFMIYSWTSAPEWAWATAGASGRNMNLSSGTGGTPLNSVIDIEFSKANGTFTLTANGISRSSYQGEGLAPKDTALCIGATNVPFDYVLKGYLLSIDIIV